MAETDDVKRSCDRLVYTLFGKKHPFVANSPALAPTLPHAMVGVEMLKRIVRTRPIFGASPQAAAKQAVESLQRATQDDEGAEALARSIVDSHSIDASSSLRLTLDYGVIDPDSGVFVPGIDQDIAERALAKLNDCVSACSSISPVNETIEYVHDAATVTPFFSNDLDNREPLVVTTVSFSPSCEKLHIRHRKRVRLWTCVTRPTSITTMMQPADGEGRGGDDRGEDDRVVGQLEGSRISCHEPTLFRDQADMRISVLCEKALPACEYAVVLPSRVRLIRSRSYTFREGDLEWRYTVSLSWTGDFDEDAEYAMLTGGHSQARIQIELEPVNIADFFHTARGASASSLFQTMSMLLKGSQLIAMPVASVTLRCFSEPYLSDGEEESEEAGNWLLKAFKKQSSHALTRAFRDETSRGSAKRHGAGRRQKEHPSREEGEEQGGVAHAPEETLEAVLRRMDDLVYDDKPGAGDALAAPIEWAWVGKRRKYC